MRRTAWRRHAAWTAANVAVLLFILLPLVAIVFASVQTEKALIVNVANPLPKELTAVNFEIVLLGKQSPVYLPSTLANFRRAFGNSVVVACLVTLICLGLAALAAYAAARLGVRWARSLMYANLSARMVPIIVVLVPLFITLRNLRLLNSLAGVIVTEVGFLLPYAVWMLAGYLETIPAELEDAARIDGCTRVRALWRIILPLAMPGVAATGVILFIFSWNELVIPLVVATTPGAMTLPVLLASLVTDFNIMFTILMTICLLGLLPTVILAVVFQRSVIRGLLAGAMKG
jgi:multiple sugar transport system permease protein